MSGRICGISGMRTLPTRFRRIRRHLALVVPRESIQLVFFGTGSVTSLSAFSGHRFFWFRLGSRCELFHVQQCVILERGYLRRARSRRVLVPERRNSFGVRSLRTCRSAPAGMPVLPRHLRPVVPWLGWKSELRLEPVRRSQIVPRGTI